ncbi:kinesin-like protein Klp61F isoform X2 [Zootermopsis nevadensis]|uniref:kinesin-like protein Klp61F isoform X2 n=1 Tax=Zootermopsis nevadensis TaxID=136037 RepID=UPI000B8E8A3D|nr:kinesin-like protein Klp61F isoform X2 [Zootermopsis nevadensis]
MLSKQQKDRNQNIQVFVRVRHLNSQEKTMKSLNIVECPNSREVIVKERPSDKITRTFAFDRVFGPNSRQIDVYMSVVHPIISEVLDGYNCTVFAYGQTGTGKTFTMEGEKSNDASITWDTDPLSGIIPRTLSNLFDELRIQQVEFTVRVSFLELYNEELLDLLSPTDDSSKIRLFEDATKKGSVIIHGLEEVTVHNKNEVYAILEKGSLKRQTAATLMNAQSSRSHTVFSITVHIKENSLEGDELLKTGKLNLVDLAGSENIGRSGAVDKRAREAGNINQSLLTLGRVITALVERAPHVPYRESKLTRLLQDSLGGRTKTSIIATISPAACNVEETLSTLDYACRAKNITNRPEINQKLTKKALIKEYTAEIERLRRDLAATRDKNGVYMASDNYTQMIMQLEHQEQEISQMLGHMKALKEELDKKESLCAELNISLDSCNQKLATTSSELEVTQDKLNDTSVKLRDTLNMCTEKEHLIEKHVHTESTLSTQAQSLLAAADMASSDVEKLHDKLARKRSVEGVNQEISREFHLAFVQNVAYMEDSLNQFIQDLTKFCSGLQTNLGEQLEKRGNELASLSNEISSLVASQTLQIQDLEKMTSDQVYNGQQWIQEYLSAVHSTSDSEVNNLHKFLTETFLVPMQNLAHQLQLQEAENQAFNHMIVNQQKLDAMKTFETAQTDGLLKLRDSLFQYTKQQQQALESAQEGYRGVDKSMNGFKQTFLSEVQQLKSWADRILGIHVDFENQYNDNKNKISGGLAVVREKCDHLSQEAASTLDLHMARRIEHLSAYETQTEELLDTVSNSREVSEQLISAAKRLEEDVETSVRLAVSNGEQAWRNHYSWTEQELRKYSENLNGEFQNELKQTQTLISGLRESAESHEAILEQQQVDFGTFVRERQDDLETQCSYINGWSQTITSDLQQCSQDLDKFLVEELRKDIPTGNTPQRREFSYPRVLAATSPHERILARFREMNGDVMPHLHIPEVVSSPSGSSSANSDEGGSDMESLKDVPFRSVSVTDISAEDSIFNASHHSEPSSLKQKDNKENSNTGVLKKHRSDDLQDLKIKQPKRSSSRKALQSQN